MRRICAIFACLVWSTACAGTAPKPLNVTEVRFTGNAAFDDKRLLKSIVTRPSTFLRKVPYHESLLNDDVQALEQFYRRNGYSEATVRIDEITENAVDRSVSIKLNIHEGLRIHVEAVQLSGHRIISEEHLWPLINVKPGDGLSMNHIEESTLKLLRYYAESGFIECDVTPELQIDSLRHQAAVQFRIIENQPYSINEIHIGGLVRTNPRVVRRELSFHETDLLRYSRLMGSQRKIYLTGLFESVFIQPDTVQVLSGLKDVQILVKETDYQNINFMLGYGSLDRIRGQVEFQNRNMQGMGRQLGFKIKASAITRYIEAAYSEPWLFDQRIRMDLIGFLHWQEEPGFDYQQSGGQWTLSKKLSETMQVHLEGRLDWTRFLEIRIKDLDKEANRISSLKLTAAFDSRNSLYNPSRGVFWENSIETGRVFTDASFRFTRLKSDVRGMVDLGRLGIWASGIEGGWMFMPGGLENIPLQERFYTGGPNSVRGFAYRKVGPLDSEGVPTGGQIKLVWHVLEIRRPVWRSFGLAIFSDCAQIWENDRHLDYRDFRWSAGTGLRLSTPVGLVRVEYGWVFDRQPGEAAGQWVFSLGHMF